MLIFLVVLSMLAIAAYEVPIMVHLREWGELRAFSILWVVGLTIGILQAAGVPLPNPTTLFIKTMPPVVQAVAALFGS